MVGFKQVFAYYVSKGWITINSLTTNVPHHTETIQLICIANQWTGFYMMGRIGR